MNKSLKGKIGKLENNVLQKLKVGTTKICTCGWPTIEQVIVEKARWIAQMDNPYEEATEQQLRLLEEAGRIINFRIYDLFMMYLETWCYNDSIARITLHERFLWFIQELVKEIHQQLEVSEIERNTPPDCEVDKVDEYFSKAPETFTPESYEKLQDDLLFDWMKDMKAQGKWKDVEAKLLGKKEKEKVI